MKITNSSKIQYIEINNSVYEIGQQVIGNKDSVMFEGIIGKIVEIRTGIDMMPINLNNRKVKAELVIDFFSCCDNEEIKQNIENVVYAKILNSDTDFVNSIVQEDGSINLSHIVMPNIYVNLLTELLFKK